MKKMILIIISAILLTGTCYADNDEIIDTTDIENAVPEYVDDALDNPSLDEAVDADGFICKLISFLKAKMQDTYKPALRRGVLVLIIALICSSIEVFSADSSPLYMKLCGCAAISIVCIGDMGSYISIGAETLKDISDFSNALLPALCTAGIICGTPAAAAAKYAASALFMNIFIESAENIILPMIYAYTALVVANSAFGGKVLDGMCNLFKWLCTSLMVVLTLAFTAYLSISSAVASGGDAVASKAAKTAISMVLPVIGGIISDAASTVVAGAETILNIAGVFGLIIVAAICITPFAVLAINYLVLKAASALSEAFNSGAASLISGIGNSFGMILAMVGSAGIMMFVSIISCIKAVGV
ncbi:MAG: hypothetical protein Q4A83_02130 [Bacillota bacterium]|nr:hypothetical protein [Bacillota bacterium]